MKKGLLYIFGLMLIAAPSYAVDVSVATESQKLDFGKAVLLGNTATIGVDSGSRPLWLRSMKASTSNIPAAGTITFSSNMEDGFDRLIIKPIATSSTEFPLSGGASCELKVTNLSFSASAVALTVSAKSASINVGGSVQIKGFCGADYDYTGTISIPYSIQDGNEAEIKTGVAVLPVEFHSEYKTDVTKDTDMNFGTVITNGVAGTVVMSTEGNITSTTGGVVRVSGNTTAGQVSIYGAENLPISNVTYDEMIYLYNGTNTMTVDTFTLSPGRTFTLNESKNGQGYKMLKIGGTLHVGEKQPTGDYSGILHVRIFY
jgi:hypothetical protein